MPIPSILRILNTAVLVPWPYEMNNFKDELLRHLILTDFILSLIKINGFRKIVNEQLRKLI